MDRIVAVVNEDIITLTDLRIAEAFGLGFALPGESSALSRQELLNRMIDRKLVVQSAPEDMLIEEAAIQIRKQEIRNAAGPGSYEEALERFGMEDGDLNVFVRDEIIYRRIVNRRFSQGVVVSLDEMEAYYRNQYLPAQQAAGKTARAMTDMLNEIEAALKQARIENQLRDWLEALREKADIRVDELR